MKIFIKIQFNIDEIFIHYYMIKLISYFKLSMYTINNTVINYVTFRHIYLHFNCIFNLYIMSFENCYTNIKFKVFMYLKYYMQI